jgi:hypothetical protein
MECLFRFYSYGLERAWSEPLYRDFEDLALKVGGPPLLAAAAGRCCWLLLLAAAAGRCCWLLLLLWLLPVGTVVLLPSCCWQSLGCSLWGLALPGC